MTYQLENAWQGFNVRDTETNKTLNFQIDWDYPRLADSFGAHVVCDCGATDGTVDCPHKTASKMIEDGVNWLSKNDGAETEECYGDYPEEMWEDG